MSRKKLAEALGNITEDWVKYYLDKLKEERKIERVAGTRGKWKSIMKRFRLPRKTKKSLKGNLWLYPADEKGNSLMAFPARSQEDYAALKKGIVKNIMDHRNTKAKKKAFRDSLNKEVVVSDDELKHYVDNIIRQDLRTSSYNTLVAARHHPKAVVAYYNFVNAYQLYEKGNESYGNICCLSLDRANELLKKKKKK